MKIRTAKKNEISWVKELIESVYLDFKTFLTDQVWDDWMKDISIMLEENWDKTLIAEEHGDVFGTIQLVPSKEPRFPKRSANLRMLAVRKDMRNKGVGKMLTKECIKIAKAKGFRSIFLHTNNFMTAAIVLYERVGFQRAPEYDPSPLGPDDDTIAYCFEL